MMRFTALPWTPPRQTKGPVKQGLTRPPPPSFCPCVFLELDHQFFHICGIVLETHMKFCTTNPDFLVGKFFAPEKQENGSEIGFFEFIEKFRLQFLLNQFNNENLFFILKVPAQIPYLEKVLFLRYGPKYCLSANQIAEFFNQPYLRNKLMKQPEFVHTDAN